MTPYVTELVAGKVTKRRARRKKSEYQKELGRQMKAWKKAHPRAKPGSILSHAHKKTKTIIRKKQRQGLLPKGRL